MMQTKEPLYRTPDDAEAKIAVIVLTFDRPKYLKRALNSISQLRGLRDASLFFFVDGPYDKESSQRCAEAAQLCDDFDHPDKEVITRPKNVGTSTQVYGSKSYVFDLGYDFAVTIEDDFVCAPYALQALITAHSSVTALRPQQLFTLDVFNKNSTTHEQKLSQLHDIIPCGGQWVSLTSSYVWSHVAPLLSQYNERFILPLIEGRLSRPYRSRPSVDIRKWYGHVIGSSSPYYAHVTNPKYPSSQDGCVAVAMMKNDIVPFSTCVNHAVHIGKEGEHMTPELHAKMGLDDVRLDLFDEGQVLAALRQLRICDAVSTVEKDTLWVSQDSKYAGTPKCSLP
jgi:hypothetical protein